MNNPGAPRKALGRGLEALLKPPGPLSPTPPTASRPAEAGVRMVAIREIQVNPQQPRQHFDSAALEELAQSIREQGVLQPLLVRPAGTGLQLIAGERRWRAAQLAGLAEVPVLVRPLNDERALEVAIIENLQREDLNPIEQARAFQQLSSRFALTQEQIAQRTGKERASVANFMRLLKLDPEVQALVENSALTMGHARALLGLEAIEQRALAATIQKLGLNVRQVEERVAAAQRRPNTTEAKPAPPRDPNVRAAEEDLQHLLGTKVRIKDRKNRGTIEIDYVGLEEFQRIFERLHSR